MNKILILAILALPLFSYAQRKEKIQKGETSFSGGVGAHTHDGFYLSMSAGMFFDNISDKASMPSAPSQQLDLSGSGIQFDIKLGGTIVENAILHATIVSSAISGPDATLNGKGYTTPNDFTVGETLLGIGGTYYFMPTNFFGSASFGIGRFSIYDGTNSSLSDRGFGMQLKAGKEWWVGRNWGLGIAATYGKTVVTNTDGSVTEKLNSNNFGILFNATFN